MRITESRYNRDRRRHDLAMRLLGLEARTQTIRLFTGLTEDRVRKLYRSYLHEERPVRRRRGRSPRQAAFFLHAPAVAHDTRALAATLTLFGAVRVRPEMRHLPPLEHGHRLCDAYETYKNVVRTPLIDFEHGELLAHALARGDELHGVTCRACGALNVLDRSGPLTWRCCACPEPLSAGAGTADADRIGRRNVDSAPEFVTKLSRRPLHRPTGRVA